MKLLNGLSFYLCTLVITSAMMTSCGLEREYADESQVFAFGNAAVNGGRALRDDEMSVALRVCYAFRSKRAKYSAELIGSDFPFNYQTKSCKSKTPEVDTRLDTKLSQLLINGPLSYESIFPGSYAREVQTDLNGLLTDLCGQVLKGETPLNYQENDNGFSEYIFTSGIYDNIEIRTGAQVQEDGPIVVNNVVKLEVLTNQVVSGDLQGIVVKTTRSFPCRQLGDTEIARTMIQTYIEPTSSP
jgi:hypothetical protein